MARYLLDGEYMSGYNFGPIENWDVSNETNLRGLFGITETYAWDREKTYETGDIVARDSTLYRALNTNINKRPDYAPHASHWEKLYKNYIDSSMKTAIENIVSNNNFNKNDTNDVEKYRNARDLLKEKLALFNADLSNWNVSNVTNFEKMFYGLPNYNQPWSWTYQPNNFSATYKDMFAYATSMSHDIEFTDLVGSYTDPNRSITVSKFQDVMTGTNASLVVDDFATILLGFESGADPKITSTIMRQFDIMLLLI